MAVQLTDPQVVECKPYHVVGFYATYEGDNEGPGWEGAYQSFLARKDEITGRTDTNILGFLYKPYIDHPELSKGLNACFIGVTVKNFNHVPKGMKTTRFPGGSYVVMNCIADTQDEASESVGEMVGRLMNWIKANGREEGEACFASSNELEEKPPFMEYVYIHFR